MIQINELTKILGTDERNVSSVHSKTIYQIID